MRLCPAPPSPPPTRTRAQIGAAHPAHTPRRAAQFSNLYGSVHTQGNLEFTPDGQSVLSPVGNRISIFNLTRCTPPAPLAPLPLPLVRRDAAHLAAACGSNTSCALPFECNGDIDRIALSPNGLFLICVDGGARPAPRSSAASTALTPAPQTARPC